MKTIFTLIIFYMTITPDGYVKQTKEEIGTYETKDLCEQAFRNERTDSQFKRIIRGFCIPKSDVDKLK